MLSQCMSHSKRYHNAVYCMHMLTFDKHQSHKRSSLCLFVVVVDVVVVVVLLVVADVVIVVGAYQSS
jgi:hypothetical protein